ncbi:FAD/NAD(P)-binding domain-containing protein [Mycena indigotica]|uniref:FAD/NAD(P)-binding domain-containing protein n=1 Tax=Mycena indigotica TaxID=2126181 RepID=A0A8H6TB10_9AGAR|nr:FAD/NAD(P)-binding domain-containing protein [Mycena indigotica]KAF7315470.1 FAD/NAD(P)-binding domain-containing protein [Mycena indigotica]
MSAEARKLRVAICGGGISGLCLAVALSRHDHLQVDIWEATERFKELGAGLMVFSRTWRIFELLGLSSSFTSATHTKPEPSAGYHYRRSDIWPDGFDWHFVPFPYGCRTFHRAHFLDVFVEHLPPGVAHFGKRLETYEEQLEGEIKLRFTDGTTASCDLLVGCDGIKSTVRKQMLRAKAQSQGNNGLLGLIKPIWTGTIAYRGLVPATKLIGLDGQRHRTLDSPMMKYCGKNKHIVAYAISRGEMVNVVAYVTDLGKENTTPDSSDWVVACDQQEMLQAFSGWERDAFVLLENIETPTKWNIHRLSPLPQAMEKRVVLMGDALHAMTPHLGVGATNAIEDAFILETLLAKCDSHSLDSALMAYEAIRLSQANRVLELSDEAGKMFEFNSSYQKLEVLGPAISNQWAFLTSTTPEDEAKRALALLT